MSLVDRAPRHLFFTGKGGVGKTSTACATALGLAELGRRVLLVSTDPASNLDEVLETPLGAEPRPVVGVERLFALNIDPEAAAHAYRERMVGPYRGVLPDAAVRSIEEQLSGACTVEIAAFDEFSKLLSDGEATAGFDHVVFDTAPTGHTLRLLEPPAAWTGFLQSNAGGTSCLGPLAGLKAVAVALAERGHAVAGRALLEEDLRSPCTEEVAVFRAFARVVDQGEHGFVVIDTAPTGHTLLLLDAAEAYHREVLRTAGQAPDEVRRLLPRLRDPMFTRILLVTLPEATPVHEAASLQRDLGRAEIQPFAWVINQALTPLSASDPTLRQRRAHEARYLREVASLSERVVIVPWTPSSSEAGVRLDFEVERRHARGGALSAPSLARRAVAELVGTALLLATVVGSGIMGESLAGGNVAIALLANTIATGAGLIALILTFGPVSGAHFNPAVTMADASQGGMPWREVPVYLIAQVTGAFLGVALAHVMFKQPAIFFASEHERSGIAQLVSEFVATFGLLAVIWGCVRRRADAVPFAVGAYITAAYWFTASTSFANPAVTLARAATNTFAGIRPADAPGFIVAQLLGAAAATAVFRWLVPELPKSAARVVARTPEIEREEPTT